MQKTKVVNNTIMLYIMTIAKLIFPLCTLPYLTRVLSEEAYGFVAYVKSCMTYMQLIVDFGFILSAVKDIVNANGDKRLIGEITGNTFVAKLCLSVVAGLALAIMCMFIEILQLDILFVALSFVTVATTSFLDNSSNFLVCVLISSFRSSFAFLTSFFKNSFHVFEGVSIYP